MNFSAINSNNLPKVEMVECPYHHKRWRGGLQCVLNGLRGTVLHQRHVRKFPAAVCACTDRGASSVTGGLDILLELQQWLKEESEGNESLAKVYPTLEKFLTGGGNESLSIGTREALIRVVRLVRDMCRGVSFLLEPRATEKEGDEEEFSLDLPCTYLGVFMGSGGKHIKSLCKKHSVKVRLGEKGSWSGRRRPITGSTVTVTVSSQGGDVTGFKAALQKRVEEVTKKREEHRKNVEYYWKHKMDRDRERWQGRLHSGRPGPGRAYHNPKEAAKREYERQQQRSKPKGSDSRPSFAALSDGRCLHCMAPYTSGQMQEGACTYHSGFLVAIKPGKQKGFKWTCCHKRTVATHPTHELHRRTGCSTGRHVWRAGRPNKARAPQARGIGSSDFYVR